MDQATYSKHGGEANKLDIKGLCLLSLDGGGVRGLSTLYILKSLMDLLNHERRESSQSSVKPCEVFDLIGGTSTGGLIAIMLGRLEMDVDQCIAAYSDLAAVVFGEKRSSFPITIKGKAKARFDSAKLESAVSKVVQQSGISSDALFNDGTERRCRTFVCTADRDTKDIVRLRSYSLPHEPNIRATICQAALATSAATTFFEPASIGDRSFADGGLGANNPVDQVEGEASNIWCSDTGNLKPLVKCFISIGTGKNPSKKPFESSMAKFLSETVVQIATETETTERNFIERWAGHFVNKRYFRFNVEQGLQSIGLDEYKMKGRIEAATEAYITHKEQYFRAQGCIQNLKLKQDKTETSFDNPLNEYTNQPLVDLPTVKNALYDSAANQDDSLCQPGTRVGILDRIIAWASAVNAETMFWVSGPAGTGKSTISRSLAHSLANTDMLGASYFFKGEDKDRNGTALFFSTIASQLANTIPLFRNSLKRSLDRLGNTSVEDKALEEQFKTLMQTPLGEMCPSESGILTRVIIIDALDECERYDHVSRILGLLCRLQSLDTVRLRVFLTSRSAYPIVEAFEELKNRSAIHSLALHEEFCEDTKADISSFLNTNFADIRRKMGFAQEQWPLPKDMNRLIELSTNPSPLFIYASTLCRFVHDQQLKVPKNPKRQLQKWLKQCDDNNPQLNQIYEPILNELLVADDRGDTTDSLVNLPQLLQVLGSIILLATPLPARYLAVLLGVDEYDVNYWLRNLHAVLSIPTDPEAPVRLLHKSFSDFMLGQEGTGMDNFRVNATETHSMLVSKCIQCMNKGLRRNVCNVMDPGKLRDEIDKTIVDHYIPPYLEYACLHWIYHLILSGGINDADEVQRFLHTHFLHWLEVLSLIGKTFEASLAISSLEHAVVAKGSPGLHAFIYDAKRFILHNRLTIAQAPLQIYCSALSFTPETSIVREQFKGQIPRWICRLPKVETAWGPSEQTLEGHLGSVRSVAFSPDGSQLASGSDDRTVRVWNAATGQADQTLEGHSSCVKSVAFSPDGSRLASGSDDRTVRVWDRKTGQVKQTLKGHSYSIESVLFSPDGSKLVSSSDGIVRVWDVGTWQVEHTFDGNAPWEHTVAFSPDGNKLASASIDWTVRVWNVTTWQIEQTLEPHSKGATGVAFSPDGSKLATVCVWVNVWNVATGKLEQTLKSVAEDTVAFSPDGSKMASALFNRTVRLWEVSTWQVKQTLEGHVKSVRSLAFSSNSCKLASGSDDQTVRVWNLATRQIKQTLEGHPGPVESVAFSPDGSWVASGSSIPTVLIWDVSTWQVKQKLEGCDADVHQPEYESWHSCSVVVAISPDGKRLVSASYHGTIRVWSVGTWQIEQSLEVRPNTPNKVTFVPDGNKLASASGRQVTVWNTSTWQIEHRLEGKDWLYVETVAFSPDGRKQASVSYDNTLRVWDLTTCQVEQVVKGYLHPANSWVFSHDSDKHHPRYSVSGRWVTRDGSRILYLPWDYRPSAVAVKGSSLVIGSMTGRVILITFGLDIEAETEPSYKLI